MGKQKKGSERLSCEMSHQFDSLTYERRGRLAYITLNRPQRGNAISLSMPSDIRDAVELANSDDEVHCIILSGTKESKGFSGGYDLMEFAQKKSSSSSSSSSSR